MHFIANNIEKLLNDELFLTPLASLASSYLEQGQNTSYKEKDNQFQIEIDAPGFSKKDLGVTIEEDFLNVKGKVDVGGRKRDIDKKYKLPENVDKTKMSACLKNGILSITIPKKEKRKKLSIEIK
tara:strand:- start:304 stop:678 length:375 start_codon:yes stop_codon:yes gene_type:complete